MINQVFSADELGKQPRRLSYRSESRRGFETLGRKNL